ncbi:hypothetical protein JOB18_010089 [Solea senegalensis]|uniref:Uncharacterized protein n=1 Tax=Solea senegalensis TaxID=28829 RepID=A0AAV6PSB3_SOLSE|nr:hypothetical protein JOB18_010089 [Solea senegalensis]
MGPQSLWPLGVCVVYLMFSGEKTESGRAACSVALHACTGQTGVRIRTTVACAYSKSHATRHAADSEQDKFVSVQHLMKTQNVTGQPEETGEACLLLSYDCWTFLINYIYESCNYLITLPLWLPLTSRIHHGPIISFKLPMNLTVLVSTLNVIVTLPSFTNKQWLRKTKPLLPEYNLVYMHRVSSSNLQFPYEFFKELSFAYLNDLITLSLILLQLLDNANRSQANGTEQDNGAFIAA